MYIAPGQGQTAPWGQNFDVNRKALSLYPFVTSFKTWTTIVSEKSIVLPFPIQKHKGLNLTLPYNRSWSTQGHHLNKFASTRAPDAA